MEAPQPTNPLNQLHSETHQNTEHHKLTETQEPPPKPKEHNVRFSSIPTLEEERKQAEKVLKFISDVAAIEPKSNEYISQVIRLTYSVYSKHYHPEVWIVFYNAILNSEPNQ